MGDLRIGSLFSGYGGLDLAVESVFDATTDWVADIDPGPRKILAHRFPHAPNLGDVTAVDWSQVEPVDIIAGGTPCQDVSHAGRRAGFTEGTRSNLWTVMREAIAVIRPKLVVWENVRGVMSAAADSAMEPCPGCVGDRDERPVLRAFGRVLGDLAELGYDAQWHGVRASDVGAAHGRWRVFVIAHPRGARLPQHRNDGGLPVAARQGPRPAVAGSDQARAGMNLLPTPESKLASSGPDYARMGREGSGGHDLVTAVALLPTPGAWLAEHRRDQGQPPERRRTGGHQVSVADVACHMPDMWGDYAAAVHRHERMLGRPAPSPTEPGRTGNPRLSARFTEWLMGLPDGWVTDVPGLTRPEVLKALGNGVVPIQAEAALRHMLGLTSRGS